ncbi:MAG: phosphohydrolase, partial [Clostridiales bacterium]|nr:phosphohydrolase [Clostridiales bacterium]
MKKTKAEDQKKGKIIRLLHNNRFQRLFVGIVTIILAFFIIGNGAAPIRYKLSIGEASRYDITSPRDIENSMKTDEMAENVAEAVSPVMIRLGDVPIDILNSCDELFKKIETTKNSVSASLKGQGITTKSSNYNQKLELEQAIAAKKLKSIMTGYNITISDEQVKYLILKTGNDDLAELENLTRSVLSSLMKEEVTGENITEKIAAAESTLQKSGLTQDLKNIGGIIVKALVKPNSTIDYELTNAKKQEAYKNALENRQIISEGSRILSVGDTVTEDKLEVLKELNLLDDGRIDFVFAMGILALLILLAGLLVLYLRLFFKKILSDRNELIIIGIVVLLDLLLARVVKGYSVFIIPVFIAPMLISILIDMRLAIMINTLLALSVSMMTGWNIELLFLTIIAGSISSFLVSKTTQRGRLSVEGLIAGVAGALSVAFVGMLNKEGLSVVAINSSLVVLNGIISSIFTIGLLPFFESVFNIVTPLKLLELSNPTQPLLKRLLMEAPGTYHHSLMVGNLAESATEAIGGN